MGPLKIKSGPGPKGRNGVWVEFDVDGQPTFVPAVRTGWVWIWMARYRARKSGTFRAALSAGRAGLAMLEMVKSLLAAGVTVKIFSARACEPENIPIIQDWAVKHGLGKLEVTNQKDFNLIRFYDDRAIQICPNLGVSVAAAMGGAKLFQESPQQFYQRPTSV